MPSMTKEEVDKFLQEPVLARVGFITEDGSPTVIPVWFDYDGQNIFLIARQRSKWLDYIAKDPRVCVTIDADKLPYEKVIIQGTASIIDVDWLPYGERCAERYFGNKKYLGESIDQPRVMVKIPMTKFVSWKAVGDGNYKEWHPRYLVPGTNWANKADDAKANK